MLTVRDPEPTRYGPKRYARVRFIGADDRRRTAYLEILRETPARIVGYTVDREGDRIERPVPGTDGLSVELLVLDRKDLLGFVPMRMNLHYCELEPVEPHTPPSRGRRDPQHELWERWIRRVLDTRDNADLGPMGYAPGDGTLVSWHATDDPEPLLDFLRRRRSVVAGYGERGSYSELGPGLYLGNPGFWSARSTAKWRFLETLPEFDLNRLLSALSATIRQQRASGYITQREADRAERAINDIDWWKLSGRRTLVSVLANQPYNIAFWRAEYLRPLGIAPSGGPAVVEVALRGRFAELSGTRPPPALLRQLRRGGLQGAFTRPSMATNGEIVVWDPRAIVSARLAPEISV